jgi:uncharacterized protein (UPF0335 family)
MQPMKERRTVIFFHEGMDLASWLQAESTRMSQLSNFVNKLKRFRQEKKELIQEL